MAAPDATLVATLRADAVRIEAAIRQRNESIRSAYAGGMSAAAIAEAVGLTRQQIHRIVRAS